MIKKPFYLTTTLPYVNDNPHLGHALEFVHADIFARHQRLMNREVFFTTGTDEHGQKIFQKASEAGQDVQTYVDHYAEQFKKLKGFRYILQDHKNRELMLTPEFTRGIKALQQFNYTFYKIIFICQVK